MLLYRFAGTLLFTLPLLAADAPLPELKVEPASGGSVFTVKNTYSQPLSAFVIELVNYPGSTYAFLYDEPGAGSIAAGAEKKINVANMTVGAVPEYVKLLAAVYQDGSTGGAAEKIKGVLDRRKTKLDTTRELIQRIEKAQADGKTKDAIVTELREWANSLAPANRGLRAAPADSGKAAARIIVATAASHISTQTVADELANLKKAEGELAASKPSL